MSFYYLDTETPLPNRNKHNNGEDNNMYGPKARRKNITSGDMSVEKQSRELQ